MTGTIASDEGCASMLAESGIIHDLIELLKGFLYFYYTYIILALCFKLRNIRLMQEE